MDFEFSQEVKVLQDRVSAFMEKHVYPIGLMPIDGDLTLEGLDIPAENWAELMKVDGDLFRGTLADAKEYLAKFGDKLPTKINEQLAKLEARLG